MPRCQIHFDSLEAPGKAATQQTPRRLCVVFQEALGRAPDRCAVTANILRLCVWRLMQGKWRLESHLCVTCRRNTSGDETGFEDPSGKVAVTHPSFLLPTSVNLQSPKLPYGRSGPTGDVGLIVFFICDDINLR